MANLLDRLIGAFNPQAGLRRHQARELLQRAYEGASTRDGWRPRRAGASADTDHRADAATLRVRARSLVKNTPYVARGLGSMVANVIGTGINPRSLGKDAKRITALWQEWSKVADADGVRNLGGLQAAAYRAMEQDGEVLVRLRARRPSDGLPVPLQLQLLEIDWLDSSKVGSHGANTIINGIEYDPLGKRVAYWLFDQHPGEVLGPRLARTSSSPVPAERIIHLFNPERPGQGRGFTRLAPVISRVRDLQLYEDAEAQRKNLESRLSVIASGDVNSMGPLGPEDQRTPDQRSESGDLGTLSSGSIIQVPSGLNITTVQPNAVPGYVDYVKLQLHLIAAGMGITYEMLTGDVREVNFSSARVAILEYRRNAEQLQWLTLIPGLCEPIWRAFIDAAVLANILKHPDYSCDWATPKWDYVNPVQDVAAELDAIAGGLCTISESLRRRGMEPELFFTEYKADFERLQRDGTLDFLMMLQKGRTMGMGQAQASQSAGKSAQ
ncbi:phage portal protein [Curvibacter lanceolatus]|uniref:phage portal protein n=1 Tax=Curvibacter lanceolatus TaxID=86182 RepID=UPI0003815FD8|nr:phage portal protein [Curvibacter lanceolatus]